MDTLYSHFLPPTSDPTQLNELILSDGKYEGELKDTLRHGLGVFIWDNGDAYFGHWIDDRMHGKGIFCYNTGHYIEGTFAYDFLEGPACITYPDKSFTKGIFKRGELNGRVLSYDKEKHSWALQDYERGKLKGVCYEGKGMPLTYDFALNTYGQDFGGLEKKDNDTDYMIKSVRRDLAAAFSLGCFELEYGIKHYGIIKNNRIEGLGIRLLMKGIEVGKYREERLDGVGRRLEFGRELYDGEFLQGRYYGQGKMFEWKNRDNLIVMTTGVFTSGILMQKIKEERVSLDILNETLRYDAGEAKAIKISIRDYKDTFARNYAEIDSRNEDSKTIETTIKEIAYAKILSRETVIECQEVNKGSIPAPLTPESIQNSPSRRALMDTSSQLAKMVNALNNDPYDVTTTLQATQGYIDRLKKRLDDQERVRRDQNKPKRAQSSERERDMEPSFSQVFTIGVDDRPSTVRTHRSVSRDTARYGHVTINYPLNQVIVDSQVQETESHRNHKNVGLENRNKPITANIDAKYNFGFEATSPSPLLSATRYHTETEARTAYGIADSERKLTKTQKNSRSSTDLHARVLTSNDESSEKVLKTLTYSGAREPSPVRKAPLTVNTKRIPTESSTLSGKTSASTGKFSVDRSTAKFGSSRNLNVETTPKKGNASMNRANSSSHLSSKKATTVTKGKTPLPKNPATKDRYVIAGSANKTLNSESSFIGNSPGVKKAIPASAVLPKSRESSRISKQSSLNSNESNKHYAIQDTRRCHTTVETHDHTARKSARPTARGTSPAQVVELDLQCYSTAAKTGNGRKETRYDTSEKSIASTNIWSGQKPSYLKEEHSYTAPDDTLYHGSVQKTMPTERNSASKQSARSKSPLLSNIVSIDISMFKAGEGDQKQGSPVRLQTIQDNSPISYMDTKSSFISNGFEQDFNHLVDGYRTGEKPKETTGFTFMPAKEILGTFAKKREEKSFNKPELYEIEGGSDIHLNEKNNLQSLAYSGLQHNNVGHSFDRKDNQAISGDIGNKQDQDGADGKSKVTPGHNVNTPSFSQKNFKFTITDNIKLNYDTPKKGGRYEGLDLKSQQNIIETLSSPPYKSSAQKQLDFGIKSPVQGKRSVAESPIKNKITENDSVDSFSGYYPIKKTCGLQSDSYLESLGSLKGSPRKLPSQKGSPIKYIQPILTNQSDLILMTESNNDNIKIIGEDANLYPETLSIALSSNRGDTPSRPIKGLKEESECKLDLQALPTLSSKYEVKGESSERIPLTASSGKPVDVSPERRDKSQSSQASSKATSTAYFGLRSGPTTPQIDFDISGNYPIVKHPVEEAVHHHEEAEYFSLKPTQQDNFANKIGVKRPKLVVEPKTAMENGAYSVSTSDYRSKIDVDHYMRESPYKVGPSNRGTTHERSMVSAMSSIQEEWGAGKEANNLSSVHFGAEDYNNKVIKFALTPQGQLSQICGRPEETRTTLSYNAQPSVRVFQSKNNDRGQVLGTTVAINGLYNPGVDLRPPMSGSRTRSLNKSQNRNGDVSRGGDTDLSVSFVEEEARSRKVNQSSGNKVIYDRYSIADEDDVSEEKIGNLKYDLSSRRKMETKRASAENDFSGASAKRMK